MQFELEKGTSYIFNESVPEKSYEMFNRHLKQGFSGLCLAEDEPSNVKKKLSMDVPVIKVSGEERPDGQTIGSKRLIGMNTVIVEFLKARDPRKIVILDCMDILMRSNEFTNLMKFLHQVNEDIAIYGAILILPANLNELDEKRKSYLTREFNIFGKELIISHLI
jgi:hypothetical protein